MGNDANALKSAARARSEYKPAGQIQPTKESAADIDVGTQTLPGDNDEP